ncbi:TraR/DksA family transcriptional regulator [Altererythrobacter sp.]|nr:TraR/DksA family transcriptional regulator [Altererythrobacter sp.]
MTRHAGTKTRLQACLADLLEWTEVIGAGLRQPLDADSSEQAVDLSDDEAPEGADVFLRAEIGQIRAALIRTENGA